MLSRVPTRSGLTLEPGSGWLSSRRISWRIAFPNVSARYGFHFRGASKAKAFFDCWTRKEAVLKASGEGIGERMDQIEVFFSSDLFRETPCLLRSLIPAARIHPRRHGGAMPRRARQLLEVANAADAVVEAESLLHIFYEAT